MPQRLVHVGDDWTLITDTVPEVFTVQARPPRVTRGGRLFLARGTDTTAPPADAGLYFDAIETSGHGGLDLQTLDPGGTGDRLWARWKGPRTIPVWCSWSNAA